MAPIAKTLALAMVLLVTIVAARSAEPVALASPPSVTCTPATQCCKVCDTGQACGDSCINRSKQCHKGRGCACNASEICAEP